MLPVFFYQTPFFRLLLPFVAGIVVGFCFMIPAAICLSGCAVLLIAMCIMPGSRKKPTRRRLSWIFGILLNLFLFAAGAGVVSLHSSVLPEQSEQGVWLAVVEEPLVEKENSMKATVRIRANLANEQTTACDEKIMAYFRKDSASRQLKQGDLVVMDAMLNPVNNAGNPHEFDYRSYLNRRNIGRSAFAESGKWKRLDGYAQTPLLNLSNKIRIALLEIFERAGLRGNEFAVVSALVLGYTAELDDDLYGAYAASGAMHVLSVSGLHVGIVYMMLLILLKPFPFLQRTKWLKMLIVLTTLWLYALVTGMSPPVMRAAAMFSFVTVGEAWHRKTYIYNSILASAFVLLVINPANLLDVGFQLSYTALLGIVSLHPHFYKLLSFKRWLPDQAWSLACVSVAAQLGTAPLALYYFHQFPTYFLLTNFIVIPLSTIIIYGAVVLFVVSPIHVLSDGVGWLLDRSLYFFNSCIFFVEKLPGSIIWGVRFQSWEIFLSYLLIAAIGIWAITARKTWLFATSGLCLLWITVATVRDVNDLHRQQLTVYHTRGNTLLQFANGRNNTIWYTDGNRSFNAPHFTEAGRISLQLDQPKCILLDSALLKPDTIMHYSGIYANENFVEFAGKRLAVFTRNRMPRDAGQRYVKTDIVILTQNVNVEISQIVQSYSPGIIVVDASNSTTKSDRWEKECHQTGVQCHRVDRDGAFILSR